MLYSILPTLNSLIKGSGDSLLALLPISIALGAAFTLIGLVSSTACNPDSKPWWKKSDLLTDLCYWFVIPLFTRYLRVGLLVMGATVVFGLPNPDDIVAFLEHGHGTLARLPLWGQVILYLALSDFMLYWIHRVFHGNHLWKYHAVHHSSEELEWISAGRFHPLNILLGTILVDVVLILSGIAPDVLIFMSPFNTAMSAFVHANLNWNLGPFKYILASPVFHRWHHTFVGEDSGKNFASTFPFLDLLFGTFYMPEKKLPSHYGIGDPEFPESFGRQILYPLKR
jgi:sterol desaturase/sphingolipid hydroxylase (fatty acid hydroxylase superfamily)